MLTKYNKKIRRASKIHAKLRKQKKIRLILFKSNRHLYAQLVDDTVGKVLYTLSTLSADIRARADSKLNKEVAALLGSAFAERCPAQPLLNGVIFDKGRGQYCGVVKAFAEALGSLLNSHQSINKGV